MSTKLSIVFLVAIFCTSQGQRPPYAGTRPIGYPELGAQFQDPNERPAYENVFDKATEDTLGDRFGDGTTTTIRIPIDALGDKYLVDMISRWPVDKQPFWYINAMHIEKQRNQTTAQLQAANQQNTSLNTQANQPTNLGSQQTVTTNQPTQPPNQPNQPANQPIQSANQPTKPVNQLQQSANQQGQPIVTGNIKDNEVDKKQN